jgi:hypothetical protein
MKRNCRSLGFARDDKKERVVVDGRRLLKERVACRGSRDRSALLGGCDFLPSFAVRGRKAPKSICQQASPRSFDYAL